MLGVPLLSIDENDPPTNTHLAYKQTNKHTNLILIGSSLDCPIACRQFVGMIGNGSSISVHGEGDEIPPPVGRVISDTFGRPRDAGKGYETYARTLEGIARVSLEPLFDLSLGFLDHCFMMIDSIYLLSLEKRKRNRTEDNQPDRRNRSS